MFLLISVYFVVSPVGFFLTGFLCVRAIHAKHRHITTIRFSFGGMNRFASCAIILAIATLGGVGTSQLYDSIANDEALLSRETFRAEFSPLLSDFQTYMTTQFRGLLAMSDALATHETLPSLDVIEKVGGST